MNEPQIIANALFLFALGCCIGSFLNVVIWRLPYRGELVTFRGKTAPLTLSWPPSHCPKCDAAVRWYQNIPIFAWFFLRGQCANCKAAISIRYPLVEAGTGVIFAALYLALFVGHWLPGFDVLGENIPATAALIVYLLMAAILLAASAIDADWYIIPGSLTVLLTAIGLVAAPLIDHPAMPVIPTGNADMYRSLALATIGGVIGLILANLMLWRKLIPRSFEQAEKRRAQEAEEAAAKKPAEGANQPSVQPLPTVTRKVPILAAALAVVAAIVALWFTAGPKVASLATPIGGVLLFLLGVLPRDASTPDVTDDVVEEISSPESRMEILKELLFVALPALFAVAAMALPFEISHAGWVARLLGSMLGFLAGGGIVWLTRIGGTLGFGREAMGLGDAHLMAAVGAVLGAKLVLVAFFIAPVLGLLWAIVLKITGKPNVLPYGPWLSIASLLSLICGNQLLDLIIAPR